MEKPLEEDDLKGLEAEIDSAVDRLFVEEKKEIAENLPTEAPFSETSLDTGKPSEAAPSLLEKENRIILENPVLEKPLLEPQTEIEDFFKEKITPLSVSILDREERPRGLTRAQEEPDLFAETPSVSVIDPLERLETQLLSLEWEITKEGIAKAKERVIDLRSRSGEQTEIISVLNRMEMVLDGMLKNEAGIHPSVTKFLIDAKETVKLLKQKDTTHETRVYKQLAFEGIEGRFVCLNNVGDRSTERLPETGWKKMDEIANKIDFLSARMDESLGRIGERLYHLERKSRNVIGGGVVRQSAAAVMVFKVNGNFFGVLSDQVFKLFKIPVPFRDKCMDQQRIRVKDIDVKLVDLKKIISIRPNWPAQELKILIVKDDGEFKGLMIEQVLQKVPVHSAWAEGPNDFFMGSIPWTYQEQPVEIFILNVKKL